MELFELMNLAEISFATIDVNKHYLWACLLFAVCGYAIFYIFQSIGLYTIAKNNGFNKRWMAFVPFLNTYYIGVVSEKNKVFKAQAKHVALAAAIVEFIYVAVCMLYYISVFLIFSGGYAKPIYSSGIVWGEVVEHLSGYEAVNLPEELNWAWWVFAYAQNYIAYFIQIAYVILNMFVLVSFFRTYASSRYVLFSLLCVFFPIKGIIIFAVRNNRGRNYFDFIREQRQRQYAMYQEYMRNGGQGGNYNPNGYGGNPYAQQQRPAPPEDPFGGLGEKEHNNGGDAAERHGSDDPFDNL